MNDKSLKHGTALGTQPARAISDISAGVSTHSAWASAIAFGTSGGFSPTSAENKNLERRRRGGGNSGLPHFWPHRRDWFRYCACAAVLLTAAGVAAARAARAAAVARARAPFRVAVAGGRRLALRGLLRQTLD